MPSGIMPEKNTTAAREQSANGASSSGQRAGSLYGLVVVLLLLPSSALAEEPEARNIPVAFEWKISTPATFFDQPRFTLSPVTTLANSALSLDRRALLAQAGSAPPAGGGNITATPSIPPWGAQKSYLIPALEIIGFQTLLNLFDRASYGCCDYDTDFSSIARNLRRGWGVDSDDFTINQLGHPYQGSMYHGFARASGLNYWQSLGYTFAGS
jgi:hypothetical protein